MGDEGKSDAFQVNQLTMAAANIDATHPYGFGEMGAPGSKNGIHMDVFAFLVYSTYTLFAVQSND